MVFRLHVRNRRRLSHALLCRAVTFPYLLITLGSALFAGPLRIVTTTEDLASIAREISGEQGNVIALVRGTQDPHYIQVRPSDMIKVSRAELFVMVGLDLETWAFPILDGARNPKVRPGTSGFVDASAGIEPLEVPAGKVDRSMGDVHPRGNPHYWLDPANGKIIAKNIVEGLSRIRPEHSEIFKKNFEAFCRRIDLSIAEWKKKAEPLRNMKVVTYHKTWSYFAKAYGLEVVNYVEPRAGVPPSPKHIQELITQIRKGKISLLIADPYFDVRLPQKIAGETGSVLVVLAPSVGAVQGAKDLFSLFDYNIGELLKGTK